MKKAQQDETQQPPPAALSAESSGGFMLHLPSLRSLPLVAVRALLRSAENMSDAIQNERLSTASWLYRYGFLLVCIILVVMTARHSLGLPADYRYDRYQGVIVPLMLLLNHLAFQLPLPKLLGIAVRSLAVSWIVFSIVYIFYLSDRLDH